MKAPSRTKGHVLLREADAPLADEAGHCSKVALCQAFCFTYFSPLSPVANRSSTEPEARTESIRHGLHFPCHQPHAGAVFSSLNLVAQAVKFSASPPRSLSNATVSCGYANNRDRR